MKTLNNIDKFGRIHSYLRVSLTDKCNLSCKYCNPPEFRARPPLKSKEIVKIIKILSDFGITKVRFTGGEPLLRSDLFDILNEIKKIKKICLTTNGLLLRKKIHKLKISGLDSINVSLDSLYPERFKQITGKDNFMDVIDGINAAISNGINVKVNCVALKDLTNHEIDKFIVFSADNSIDVRFIELMPFCSKNFINANFMPVSEIKKYVLSKYQITSVCMDGVAKMYEIFNAKIGFISPISHPFCFSCNRLRLSSDGILYRCLFDINGFNMKNYAKTRDIEHKLKKYLEEKKESHNINNKISSKISMRFIGG
ncbi:MAG: GTP 3',8-cyclase MoaA [Elusimicrobia bacterium]|nr:GTP 3',8-cyclase MoaA [Elusimicrobiota bacterium]